MKPLMNGHSEYTMKPQMNTACPELAEWEQARNWNRGLTQMNADS
jgi:hypothetical protein